MTYKPENGSIFSSEKTHCLMHMLKKHKHQIPEWGSWAYITDDGEGWLAESRGFTFGSKSPLFCGKVQPLNDSIRFKSRAWKDSLHWVRSEVPQRISFAMSQRVYEQSKLKMMNLSDKYFHDAFVAEFDLSINTYIKENR